MRARLAAALVGAVLLIVGVAVIYWPAVLLLAGVALLAYGLLNDDGKFGA